MLEQSVQLFITPGKALVVVHPAAPNQKAAALTEYSGSCGTAASKEWWRSVSSEISIAVPGYRTEPERKPAGQRPPEWR
eukprot:1132450-Heterocapsa_arctica.AAC.1